MYTSLRGFSSPKPQDTLWRYMSFEKFASLLATESLHFARADTFEDPYESFVPPSIMHLFKQETRHLGEKESPAVIELWKEWRKWVMCCCWHQANQESMDMWGRYDMHNSGIAIKTTMQRLKSSFTCKENVPVHICKVRYINYYGFKIPNSISDMNRIYLPFFYKRKEFRNEHEVRAIIDTFPHIKEKFFRVKRGPNINRQAIDRQQLLGIEYHKVDEEDRGRDLKVDLNTLIDEIIISPYPKGEWVTETVRSVVQRFDFHFPVNRSRLLDPPDEL